MFGEIFRFELRQQLRSPASWLIALVFFGLGVLGMSGPNLALLGVHDGVLRNAPLVIANALAMLGVLGILAAATFAASAALRDFDCRTEQLVLVTPVSRLAWTGGRFAVAWLLALVALLAATLGIAAANALAPAGATTVGATSVAAYLWAFGLIAVPGSLLATALLFLVAARTRSLLATFVAAVMMLVLVLLAHFFMRTGSGQLAAALLDPFGEHALQVATRYWATDAINRQFVPLAGAMLLNRLLWGGLALVALVGVLAWGGDGLHVSRLRRRATPPDSPRVTGHAPAAVPQVSLQRGAAASWRQCTHWFAFDALRMLRGTPFALILVFGLATLALNLVTQPTVAGARGLPVTADVLTIIRDNFNWLLAVVVIFYAGELVWRDRDLRVADVRDALPWPGWIAVVAKFGVLMVAVVVFLAAAAAWSIAWQLAQGYTHLQPGLYLGGLALDAATYALLAMLCLAVQVLCGNRFAGYVLTVGWLVASRFGAAIFGWNDHLVWYGTLPRTPYSGFDGFSPFLTAALWFLGYWLALGAALLVVAGLFWPRGATTRWRLRLGEARARLRTPARVVLALALLVFVASGAWIFHNTHVLNHVHDGHRVALQRANYEKAFARYRDLPQPRITHATLDIAIHPRRRALGIRGTYTLVNRSGAPIDQLLVWYPRGFRVQRVAFAPHAVVATDAAPHFVVYRLRTPLAPGATLPFEFQLAFQARGFANEPTDAFLVGNGSFFDNVLDADGTGHPVLPQIGYQPYLQLTRPAVRRRFGLPAQGYSMAPFGDQAALAQNAASQDADWVHFDVTLSTAADQTAITSGVLERTWVAGGRRYFHYVTQAPTPNVLPFASGRYVVTHGTWHGLGIDVYSPLGGSAAAERMLRAVRDALVWDATRFGPYPFRQMRVVVVPYNYAIAAESYPGVLVVRESGPAGPLSETPKRGAVDPLYQLLAHEVSHQWWPYQELPANVRGLNFITESFAQYSALMLLQQRYGAAALQPLRQYLLDSYLKGRHRAAQPEAPLVDVGGAAQGYIYYDKGALAMYTLAGYVGEANVNRVLAKFVGATRFRGPPYATAAQFLDLLRTDVGAGWQPLVDDLFTRITLFDDRMLGATAQPLADGKYAVTLRVHAAESRADGQGKRVRAPLDIPIEIGVFGAGGDAQPLYLAKVQLKDGDSTLRVIVTGKPRVAGIDPFNELTDPQPDDNRARVAIQ